MERKLIVSTVAAIAVGMGCAVATVPAHADNIFSLMNPFRWFDDDNDGYYHRHHRYGPDYWGWGGPYGWGGPWGGWGYPPLNAYAFAPRDEAENAPAPDLPE